MCYKEFGWTPAMIPDIPKGEAERLSVVFEEKAAYEYRENKKMKSGSNSSHSMHETLVLPED